MRTERGSTAWSARTIDPKFIARPADGRKLGAGWYRASIRLHVRDGRIAEPQIYVPDAKGRLAEHRSFTLTADGDLHSAEFELTHDVEYLRFDSSRSPCLFTCTPLRVTRTRVLESMLRSVTGRPVPAPSHGATPEMISQ